MNFHADPFCVGHAAPTQMFGQTDGNIKLDSRFSQVEGHRA
jgi:hypothetical protein